MKFTKGTEITEEEIKRIKEIINQTNIKPKQRIKQKILKAYKKKYGKNETTYNYRTIKGAK